jgi:hypothetical protein
MKIKQNNGKGLSRSQALYKAIADRALAQAVSRLLPTAAARVRVQAACEVCGGQSGTGAGFFRVLRFPLPIIPPISPSSYSPGAGTIGLLVAVVPSETNWIPPPTIPIKKSYSSFLLEPVCVCVCVCAYMRVNVNSSMCISRHEVNVKKVEVNLSA